jgi:hypothetical protein
MQTDPSQATDPTNKGGALATAQSTVKALFRKVVGDARSVALVLEWPPRIVVTGNSVEELAPIHEFDLSTPESRAASGSAELTAYWNQAR